MMIFSSSYFIHILWCCLIYFRYSILLYFSSNIYFILFLHSLGCFFLSGRTCTSRSTKFHISHKISRCVLHSRYENIWQIIASDINNNNNNEIDNNNNNKKKNINNDNDNNNDNNEINNNNNNNNNGINNNICYPSLLCPSNKYFLPFFLQEVMKTF